MVITLFLGFISNDSDIYRVVVAGRFVVAEISIYYYYTSRVRKVYIGVIYKISSYSSLYVIFMYSQLHKAILLHKNKKTKTSQHSITHVHDILGRYVDNKSQRKRVKIG